MPLFISFSNWSHLQPDGSAGTHFTVRKRKRWWFIATLSMEVGSEVYWPFAFSQTVWYLYLIGEISTGGRIGILSLQVPTSCFADCNRHHCNHARASWDECRRMHYHLREYVQETFRKEQSLLNEPERTSGNKFSFQLLKGTIDQSCVNTTSLAPNSPMTV